MAYAVYTTKRFDKESDKLSGDEQNKIHKIFLQLKENPYVGDQIRYRFFREKRLNGKRIYYLVYDDLKAVLLIATSTKKTQDKTIDNAVKYFKEYRLYVEELLKKD